MNKRYDYRTMEQEYVQGDMGLRELARLHDINSISLVSVQSKKREWVRKRAEFRARADSTTINLMATEEGRRRAKEAKVRDNAIDLIDEAISLMREQMHAKRQVFRHDEWLEEDLIVMRPADIAMLIDKLNPLFGKPNNVTEERSLGLSISAIGDLGPELLRGIVEATRELAPGSAERSPLPRADDPGPGGGA